MEVQQELHQSLPKLVKVAPPPVEKFVEQVALPSTLTGSPTGWAVADWLLLIYLSGVLFMTGRFLLQLGGLIRSLRKAPSELLAPGIRLVRDTATTSPYSFFHWIVCNPDNPSESDLQQILAHESEHVRQWHSADLLLAELQRIALWFNPFAWVHQRLVQVNLEYLADRAVLAGGYEKKEYQLNLLKTALQTHEFPLTNSFAQSLLKKRIKMMNRPPSRYWVWGKYSLLLGALYLSSAFVAPYRQQIVKMVPKVVQPLVSTLVEETPDAKTDVSETKKDMSEEDSHPEMSVPTPAVLDTIQVQTRKWVLEKNDTLFWAIPARATLSDLNTIQTEIASYGGKMSFNSIQYDTLQHFLTSLTVTVNQKGASGTLFSNEGKYSPIKGSSGIITRSGAVGVGHVPPDPLYTQLRQEYSAALEVKQKNRNTYVTDSLEHVMNKNGGGYGSTTYLKRYLEGSYAETILQKEGIGKSETGTLRLTDLIQDSEFILDGIPSTFEKLNKISFNQLDKVTILKAQNGKKIIQVFTN